jgi:hypothetical protein
VRGLSQPVVRLSPSPHTISFLLVCLVRLVYLVSGFSGSMNETNQMNPPRLASLARRALPALCPTNQIDQTNPVCALTPYAYRFTSHVPRKAG